MKKILFYALIIFVARFIIGGFTNYITAPKCEKCDRKITDTVYKDGKKIYCYDCKPEGIYLPSSAK